MKYMTYRISSFYNLQGLDFSSFSLEMNFRDDKEGFHWCCTGNGQKMK